MRRCSVLLIVFLALTACAPEPPLEVAGPGEPIAQQLLRAAPFLKDAQFSTLLDFESPDDTVFVTMPVKSGAAVGNHAFTGHGSLRIDPGASTFSIKLDSLLAGRPFPGDWSMIGGYLYSEQPANVTIHFNASQVTSDVSLKPGVWTPVFIDLPPQATSPAPALVFDLASSHGIVWCDDIMLVNNQKLLTPPDPAWQVARKGTQLSGGAAGQFHFALANADVSQKGWICDEADAMRARFHSLENKTLTVYSDGRAFWNGEYRPMSGAVRDASYGKQNSTPATIEIDENVGRVDRNTPGDANNDGYNETTGSYRIEATGPRLELRFTPARGVPDPRPVLEISGMSFGKILATLEGRLIEITQRTADGHVLVELPATIDRPVTVDVRVEN